VKRINLNIVLSFLLIFILSCSKQAGHTTSKIKIISGNAFTNILSTKANNGLIFYGKSTDGKSFTKELTSESIELAFPNGTWSFYAISWEYAGDPTNVKFAGKTYCAKTEGIVLKGTDTAIDMNLNNANCGDPVFAQHSFNNGTDVILPSRSFVSCREPSLVQNGTDAIKCGRSSVNNRGFATAYKLIIPQYKNFGNGIEELNHSFESQCFTVDSNSDVGAPVSTSYAFQSNMRLPEPGNGLGFSVRVYYTSKLCDDSTGIDELVLPSIDTPRTKTFVNTNPVSGGSDLVTFFQSNEFQICQGPRNGIIDDAGGVFFAGGFGTQSAPYVICSPEQLNKIGEKFTHGTYATNTKSFEIAKDLDFNFSHFNPIGEPLTSTHGDPTAAFYGSIEGNNHKISNFLIMPDNSLSSGQKVGFIRYAIGGTNSYVKNLTLNSVATMGTEKFERVGILAGEMQDFDLSNIKVFGHVEGSGHIGGVAGLFGSSAKAVIADRVHAEAGIKAKLNINIAESSRAAIGGLYGEIAGTNNISITKSSFHGSIDAGTNGNKYLKVDNAVYTAVSSGNIDFSLSGAPAVKVGTLSIGMQNGSTEYWVQVNGILDTINIANGIQLYNSSGGAVIGTSYGPAQLLYIGGISGKISGTTSIVDSSVRAERIEGAKKVGGLVGFTESTSIIRNNYAESNIISSHWGEGGTNSFIGGLIGYNSAGSFQSNFAKGFRKFIPGDSTSTGIAGYTATGQFNYSLNGPYTGSNGTSIPVINAASQSYYTGGLLFIKYFGDGPNPPVGSYSNLDDYLNKISGKCRIYSSTSNSWGSELECVNSWVMIPGYDHPRLASDIYQQQFVPYLINPCSDASFFNSASPRAAADGGKIICMKEQISAKSSALDPADHLGRNILFDPAASFSTYPDGIYKINGHGFSLVNFWTNTGNGIFSKLLAGSNISNLTIVGAKINPSSAYYNMGVLAGAATASTIENVRTDNSEILISTTYLNSLSGPVDNFSIGGLVGSTSLGSISSGKISSTLSIDGNYFNNGIKSLSIGGAVGVMLGGSLSGVKIDGTISRTGFYMNLANEYFGGAVGSSVAGPQLFEINVNTSMNFNATTSSLINRAGPVYGYSTALNPIELFNFYASPSISLGNGASLATAFNLFQNAGNFGQGIYDIKTDSIALGLDNYTGKSANADANVLYVYDNPCTNILSKVDIMCEMAYQDANPIGLTGHGITTYLSNWNIGRDFIGAILNNNIWRWEGGNRLPELVKTSGSLKEIGKGF
jgi:hypothetical protein